MPDWMYLVIAFVFGPVPLTALAIVGFYYYCVWKYGEKIVRIFEEKPLFIIPRGKPVEGAEDISIRTPEGRTLCGCYLPTPAAHRKGVVLFGLEFGSDRWACVSYTEKLLVGGYDVFTYEPRNQGGSDKDATYEPLQWVTDRDLSDARAAIKYLHGRIDRDSAGIGLFGISKGGSLALLLAAEDRMVRCVVTDGAFATYSTIVPYMRRWVSLVTKAGRKDRRWVPDWFYGLLGLSAMSKVEAKRHIEFVSVERAIRRLRQPLFMIHGGGDTYIKPEMAEVLVKHARRSRSAELWVVPAAKHNQALHIAGEEYHTRVVEFFDRHLGGVTPAAEVERVASTGMLVDAAK